MENGKQEKIIRLEKIVDDLRPKIEKIGKGKIDPDRVKFLLVNAAIGEDPKKGERDGRIFMATTLSLSAAVMTAVALGLEFNTPLGHCYINVYKNGKKSEAASRREKRAVKVFEAQFIMGYKGYIFLGHKSGVTTTVSARNIFKGEKYEIRAGEPHDQVYHWPNPDVSHSCHDYGINVLVTYAYLHRPEGPPAVEWMFRPDIERIRERDYSRKGPWLTDWGQMSKKTVIRRGYQYIPVGPDLALAIEADGRFAVGKGVGDIIDLPDNLPDDDHYCDQVNGSSRTESLRDSLGVKNAPESPTSDETSEKGAKTPEETVQPDSGQPAGGTGAKKAMSKAEFKKEALKIEADLLKTQEGAAKLRNYLMGIQFDSIESMTDNLKAEGRRAALEALKSIKTE